MKSSVSASNIASPPSTPTASIHRVVFQMAPASGFLTMAYMTTPEIARAIPTPMARISQGRRMNHTMSLMLPEPYRSGSPMEKCSASVVL